MSILSNVDYPKDLNNLSDEQLTLLSDEIRKFIITTVSKTGGHLASNLGIVELTVALHACFDCPKDKIVFDVGHQCYAHKILTGRKSRMADLRSAGGPSGFPVISESEYDAFGAGHAGTSVSAALGLARARDILGGDEYVIAVVGDGALGNGMIWEGFNDAGNSGTNMIVVLNDNKMSISRNVGAVSKALRRMRHSVRYNSFKLWTRKAVARCPKVENFLHRMKNGIKYMVIEGALFEELGMYYIGPVDGHNITEVKEALERAKKKKGPVLVHVVTKKGSGFSAAERDPSRYHSASTFSVTSGKMDVKTLKRKTFVGEFSDALVELGEKDPRVVAITAAMPDATGMTAFAESYPKRFFDVGIAEEHAVTLAAAMARGGLRPIVSVYSTFLQRSYDSIIHDVCTQKLPVILLADHAGIVGDDGQTHQGVFDIAFLRSIPNMTILSPCQPGEMAETIAYALSLDGPCTIRFPKGDNGLGDMYPDCVADMPDARVLVEGRDVAILSCGVMAKQATMASEILETRGITATVYGMRSVKPLDEEALQKAMAHPYIVTLEDGVLRGGFGSAVLEWMNAHRAENKTLVLGVPDQFLVHMTRAQWLQELKLDAQGVADSICEFMEENK